MIGTPDDQINLRALNSFFRIFPTAKRGNIRQNASDFKLFFDFLNMQKPALSMC